MIRALPILLLALYASAQLDFGAVASVRVGTNEVQAIAVAGETVWTADDGNLWKWPSRMIVVSSAKSPDSVWSPEWGCWYNNCSANGYFKANNDASLGSFTSSSVTTVYKRAYTVGIFVRLAPGSYKLKCHVTASVNFARTFVQQVSGGYKMKPNTFGELGKKSAGDIAYTLTVPNDCCGLLLQMSTRVDNASVTVTNVEIRPQ